MKGAGSNDNGRLGDGTTIQRSSFVNVATNLTNVIQISCGDDFTLALLCKKKIKKE